MRPNSPGSLSAPGAGGGLTARGYTLPAPCKSSGAIIAHWHVERIGPAKPTTRRAKYGADTRHG